MYYFKLTKTITNKDREYAITESIASDKMLDCLAKIINREFFENKAELKHLIDFINNYNIEEHIIENYHDEIVERFTDRGYFDVDLY